MRIGTPAATGISSSGFCGLALALLLASCGGGGGGESAPPPTYTVSGTVSGLSGTGLVLQDNGGDNLPIPANGAFTFSTRITSGNAYSVTVLTQPTNLSQTCTVTNGAGTVSADVSNVSVSCTTDSFTIGGAVSGYNASGLTLRLNVNGTLYQASIVANGAFSFGTPILDGLPYFVTVLTPPIQQVCTVANGSGTLAGANVANVAITCTTNTYSVGGTVNGLAGTGLVLRNNGGDDLAVTLNGGFVFSTPIAYGSTYSVAVVAQPTNPTQTCAVANSSGTVTGNVTNVAITCATNSSTIGGTVFGLTGIGLVLQNNGGDSLAVTSAGPFTFGTPVAIGSPYSVTVLTQPTNPSQTCTVTSGSGTTPITNVTNVSVTCVTNSFAVGGTVSGLAGTGLVLNNNNTTNLVVSSNGPFTFSTPVASGLAYNVTVLTQPTNPSQTCTVAAGSGTVGSGPVTTVAVTCVTNTYTIGGTITGLTGTGLVLRNNGGNDLTVPANATTFAFSTKIASGATYAVTVQTKPTTPTQTCTVTANGSGTVGGGDISNVSIACTTNNYSIGGTVTGLAGAGLMLRNNNIPPMRSRSRRPAPSASPSATPIASGQTYAVTVQTQPGNLSQTCTVTNGSGTVGGAHVTNVAVNCVTNTFTVGGTVSGINTGSGGLTLRLNGTTNLPVAANGGFTFPAILDGSSYVVTVFVPPIQENCSVTNGSGTLAGASVANIGVSCQTNTYAVGGTITGLTGTGLKLRNTYDSGINTEDLTVSAAATSFTFVNHVAYGSDYSVTVFTQPSNPTQTCTVTANGAGPITGPVTNISISCTTNTYFIGVTVSGLSTAGTTTGVVLQNNGTDNKTVTTNGSSNFTTKIASGAAYNVTVLTQPTLPSQTCTVSAPTGTVGAADVNVNVSCATNTYTIGGTISGLTGTGLVLRNNGGNDLTVLANATTFAFTTKIASGQTYAVTVQTQPSTPTQTCVFNPPASASGTVTNADIASVNIVCTTNTYTIGGTISGLTGTGLVLRNNGGNDLTVLANATTFAFTTKIASGQTYTVTVQTPPSTPTQTCAFTPPASATGTVTNADIASVNIVCTTNTYTIGGNVTGLAGTGLVLRNNGGDNKTILADGAFTFTTPVLSGSTYAVTVFTQPTVLSQTCTVTNGGSGTVGP